MTGWQVAYILDLISLIFFFFKIKTKLWVDYSLKSARIKCGAFGEIAMLKDCESQG